MNRIPLLAVADLASFVVWVRAMEKAGLVFHPEDDPADIVDAQRQPLFTAAECDTLREIYARVYETDIDPCAVILELQRMDELRASQSFERNGPNVWAAKNAEEASELAELEETYGKEA